VSDAVNPLNANLHGDLSPLVQRLGRQADLDRDGHVSAPEFAEYLDQVLHPAQPVRPMLSGDVAPYRDRLVGFDITGDAAAARDAKGRVANLAQYLEPTATHLRQIAAELGPSAGVIGPDGLTLRLPGDQGCVGVRDQGHGPIWQWMGNVASRPPSGN
jgi:hypothetical protein